MITDINSEDRLVRDLRAAIEWLNAPEWTREEVVEFPVRSTGHGCSTFTSLMIAASGRSAGGR